MATSPTPQSATPAWNPNHCSFTYLFHGCLDKHAKAMLPPAGVPATGRVRRIDPRLGRPDTDFGQGFYTTTLQRQAEDWASMKLRALPKSLRSAPGNTPVVIWFRVPRDQLASLESLAFVRADYFSLEYWSLVQHCRTSRPATGNRPALVQNHQRGATPWYDLVSGPVAAFWQQRSAMHDADQFSFHTDAAVAVLNRILGGTRGIDFDMLSVPT